MTHRALDLPAEGPAAPPRTNGELIFDAPWQSRVFGMTVKLHEDGLFEWSEFQESLIAAVAAHEAELRDAEAYDYWSCWLEAFRVLAAEKHWFDGELLAQRETAFARRPHGHYH
jgi:nitrile hydratase accessory protein